ncbi:hypothetical protein GQ85_19850 [Rhodococcus rhodochrous]|nr:hypothetical protein GQ85_19850 [Rhodococcus rhodochrous]
MTLTADDTLTCETPDYLTAARAALEACIAGHVPFSADTVRALIPAGLEAHHPNVLPALFGAYSRTHRITAIDYVRPGRKSRHGNPNRLWVAGPGAAA